MAENLPKFVENYKLRSKELKNPKHKKHEEKNMKAHQVESRYKLPIPGMRVISLQIL